MLPGSRIPPSVLLISRLLASSANFRHPDGRVALQPLPPPFARLLDAGEVRQLDCSDGVLLVTPPASVQLGQAHPSLPMGWEFDALHRVPGQLYGGSP